MKKSILIVVVLSLISIFGFGIFSVFSSNCPPSWTVLSDTGWTCQQITRDITWKITWTNGNTENKSNFAHGDCLAPGIIFNGVSCSPNFQPPITLSVGSTIEEWRETAYDRKASGGLINGSCSNVPNGYRAVFTQHSCSLYGGGGLECDPFCISTRPSEDNEDMAAGKSDEIYKPDSVDPCCVQTPILIDTSGDGFALTDAANGVMFDFNGDGISNQISWTAAGTDDAWLVLDRDDNGAIDSAREMFGNMTEQPSAVNKNGFLALAEYDKAANGGNGDGSINNEDAVFADLRLWQDLNHNGISESSELETLPALNVAEIELDYKTSKKTDEFGNEFRYRAKVWSAKNKFNKSKNKVGRWAWDVFLMLEQPNS